MNRPTRVRRSAGVSLVELLITVAIAAVLLGTTFMVIFGITKGDAALKMRTEMQGDAARALKEMTEHLRRSGPIDDNGNWLTTGNADVDGEFPLILTDARAITGLSGDYAFAENAAMVRHADVIRDYPDSFGRLLRNQGADTYYHGLGTSYEIVFRMATDQEDADSLPIDATPNGVNLPSGEIQWGSNYHAFVVVRSQTPERSGTPTNELQHWIHDPNTNQTIRKTLAVGVQRLLFETVGQTEADPPLFPLGPYPNGRPPSENQASRIANWPAAPTGANPYMIRITLCLSRLGPDGNLITIWQQANVTMRCVNRSS